MNLTLRSILPLCVVAACVVACGLEDRSDLTVDLSGYLANYKLPAQVNRRPLSLSTGIGFCF